MKETSSENLSMFTSLWPRSQTVSFVKTDGLQHFLNNSVCNNGECSVRVLVQDFKGVIHLGALKFIVKMQGILVSGGPETKLHFHSCVLNKKGRGLLSNHLSAQTWTFQGRPLTLSVARSGQ